ncbi:unnamed protein product [Adineta steineri]|uniref:Sushi domain-containing protein n=1 Tax=Adineta steineri TaxID=433720 RepID=A0A815CGL7_9BILA|nr:unnamed protein product [Adineta steineri]
MRTEIIDTTYYLLQFLLLWECISLSQAYWIRDLSYCPRKRDVTRQRRCFKSCFDDSDCRGRYRSCLCDYDCGMSCIKRGVSCPFLTLPENGKIIYSNENKFGSRATYECDPGFVLEGSKHRNCQGDMWWGPTDSVPYCTKEVFCNRPPDINNAVNDIPSTITTFHASYSVTYTCLTGYIGNGTTKSECTFLGQWTFATLKCTPIDCGSPGILRNGFLSGERFDYPNIIAFFCNDGFELIGESTTRACQENGLWSGAMPLCRKKTCGSPPTVSYGEIIQPDRTTNETIQYICQDGYQLQGSAVLKCISYQWQPTPPICKPIICEDPQKIFNGYIKSSSNNTSLQYSIGSKLKFHCPSNLTLSGSHISKCQINGSWSPKIPKCKEPIPCSIPSLPSNARYLNLHSLNQQINDGHHLEYICGNSRRRHRIHCRRGKILPKILKCFNGCRVKNEHVIYSKTFYRHKEQVHFTCNNNSLPLLNNETIHCINGTLSKQPVCHQIPIMCTVPHTLFLLFCNRPPDINNAVNDIPSTITTFHASYSVTYTCLTGYIGNGTTRSECTFLGQWTFATLKCTPIDCGSPGILRNGFLSGERFDYPNIIAFFCNDGFELIGESTTRACQENGLWSGAMPFCRKKTCGSPSTVSYGEIIQPDRTTNETIQYICQDGYQLQGSAVLKCISYQWQPAPPICKPIICEDPQKLFNGYIKSSSNNTSLQYSIGSKVKFHCPSNLTLSGSHISKCQINGSWSSKIPKCKEPISCSIPSLPSNARYLNLHSSNQQINDGHHLEYICGNSRRRHRIHCRRGKILPKILKCFNGCRVKNEHVIYSKTFYRHKEQVHFTCNNNSLPLLNNETIHCINGTLSKQPVCHQIPIILPLLNNETIHCINGTLSKQPVCHQIPIMCTVPHTLFLRNIVNTTIPSGTLFEIGTSFSYTCIQDHQPINSSAIVECLENGKLSHHAQCIPSSCKEHPPTIPNGRTIFRSTAHDSQARYRCFPGYKLEYNNLAKLTCQYGSWLPKELPRCLPVFCANPGPLLHGQIYVVLKDERISPVPIRREFRSYIPNVHHGRTIEFECDLGYVLHGPTGLTCNHGQWMPAERPRCIIENHVQPNIIFTG